MLLLLAILSGKIISCGGSEGFPGAVVTLSSGASIQTGSDGTFSFAEVPAGPVGVSVTLDSFKSTETTCVAANGRTWIEPFLYMHVNDDCIPTGGTALAKSRRFSGRAISGADVRVIARDSTVAWQGRAGRGGKFRTGEIPIGMYEIEVSKPGYVPIRRPLHISSCASCATPATFRLQRGCAP